MSGFVQGNNATPQTAQTSVPVAFTSNQISGNLNIVVIGWNDVTSTISSVSDSLLNVYQVAVPITRASSVISQAIYYCPSIRSGSNTVTVTFSASVPFADIQIAEYNGINSIDVTATGTGTSATAATSVFTTTKAGDIIVAAVTTTGNVSSPGTNFTQRILTFDGDNLEDWVPGAIVSSATATANLNNASSIWVIQAVALYQSPFVPPSYIQSIYSTPQTPQSSVGVAFTSNQFSGNLNVVVIGWSDTTSTISSVTDSNLNSYHVAAPLTRGPAESQAIYYAAGIAAGPNTVTVTFNTSVAFPDIRIAEYNAVNAVDVTSSGTGTGITSSVSSFTTTQAGDVLVGAVTTTSGVTGPAPSFNQRQLTNPDLDILQDYIPQAVVSGTMPTPMNFSTANWVAQIAAFFQAPVTLAGIASSQTFGTLTVQATGTVPVTLSGMSSSEIFGVYIVNAPATLALNGISSSELFGFTTLNAPATLTLNGIPTSEAFGTLSVAQSFSGTVRTASRCL